MARADPKMTEKSTENGVAAGLPEAPEGAGGLAWHAGLRLAQGYPRVGAGH